MTTVLWARAATAESASHLKGTRAEQDASFELVSRIMKFVEYKMDKISPVTFDPTLISLTLQTELYAGQRGQFLESVPIFRLTKAGA